MENNDLKVLSLWEESFPHEFLSFVTEICKYGKKNYPHPKALRKYTQFSKIMKRDRTSTRSFADIQCVDLAPFIMQKLVGVETPVWHLRLSEMIRRLAGGFLIESLTLWHPCHLESFSVHSLQHLGS